MRFFTIARHLHTTPPVLVRQKHLRRLNRLHKHWAQKLFNEKNDFVDPVLGRSNVPFQQRLKAMLNQPENLIDNLEFNETENLIAKLQDYAKQKAPHSEELNLKSFEEAKHAKLKETTLRIVNLHNSSSAQKLKQAIKSATLEFQRFEGDVGSPEVQAAVQTVKIVNLCEHAKQTKKDLQTNRRLEHLVQTRRSMLMYLKRVNPKRYIWTIEKLGLSDDTVSMEFHLSRKYLNQVQFYGDKTLPMKKTVRDTKKLREFNAKKAKAERYLSQHDPEALIRMAQ